MTQLADDEKRKVWTKIQELTGPMTKLRSHWRITNSEKTSIFVTFSKFYETPGHFWFDVNQEDLMSFLKYKQSFIVFVLGSFERTLIIPASTMQNYLSNLQPKDRGNYKLHVIKTRNEYSFQEVPGVTLTRFYNSFNSLKENQDKFPIESSFQPDRVRQEINRILRDNALARMVKESNNYQCQICGVILRLKDDRCYAEAHHIMPLGSLHNGLDVRENILCVCPNHHVLLDYGTIKLDRVQFQGIGTEYIEYYNKKIFGQIGT